jgi:hypothetical protein
MRSLSRVFGSVAVIFGAPAFGAEIVPSLSVGIVHTDNLTLAASDPESARVLQVVPAVTVTQESARITADAAYRMDAYRYDERGENEVHNLFDGSLTVDLVPDRFFIDLGGSRTKAIIDPESTLSLTNLPISGNRIDRNEYFAGPSFEVGAGGNVVIGGEARRNWISFGEVVGGSQLDDYSYADASLSVDNYRKGDGVTWAARYEHQETQYGNEALTPFEYRQAVAEIGFWAAQGLRVFASAGKESPWDRPLAPALEDSLWEVGIARDLGERVHIEVATGDRSFGSSGRADIRYDFDRGTTSIAYAETPTTNARDSFSPGLLDTDDPNNYLARVGTVERYISNRFQWNLGLELSRVTFSIVLFDEKREQRAQADGTPLPDEQQSGSTLSFSLSLGSRTEIFLRGLVADQEFADGSEGELGQGTVGATYELGRRTRLSLDLTSWKQQFGLSGGNDYRVKTLAIVASRVFGR